MNNAERFNYLVGGYYGIKNLNDYDRKLFILKEVEKYIREYMVDVSEPEAYYQKRAKKILETTTEREKLQDALILLNDMDGPIDLIILVKRKIKELKYEESH